MLAEFISQANTTSTTTNPATREPYEVSKALGLDLPTIGQGQEGIADLLERVLAYSVNTWGQGFLSKLYAEPTPLGPISELILGVLNTNVHVFKVSPALTSIEKTTGRALAAQFGMAGPYAGGTTQPGGSASNLTALVVARNILFPETKIEGYGSKRLVLFTSAHGHYSFEKAAQVCGLGSAAARSVPVDDRGRMIVPELQKQITQARKEGYTPFFVNATAGTTVLGSYDPMPEIAAICKQEKCWFHVDASWGGAVVFSKTHRHKMQGCELADSLTYNPHKMLNVPVTCSFLLAKDVRNFWKSNTLPASYLFHGSDEEESSSAADREIWDLADMTLQCGRKGDAFKLALAWTYYGNAGFEAKIDNAFSVSAYLASLVDKHANLNLVSENPPPCLQVCFFYGKKENTAEENTRATRDIAKKLLHKDMHVDFAAGDKGSFLRVVVNLQTRKSTVENLVKMVVEFGSAT